MTNPGSRLILASTSVTRQAILRNAGVPFEIVAPGVDETAAKASLLANGVSARDIADALAELKAVKVGRRSGALTLGSDQTLEFDGEVFDKPVSLAALKDQLIRLPRPHPQAACGRSTGGRWRAGLARLGDSDAHHARVFRCFPRPLSGNIRWDGDGVCRRLSHRRLGPATVRKGAGRSFYHTRHADDWPPACAPSAGRCRNVTIGGATMIAGVVGRPVAHSLSPLLHNAWLAAAGIDGVYVAFSPNLGRFGAFVEGLRGGVVRGVNVTVPFKEEALALADGADTAARAAGAANLLVFHGDGSVEARNTDGLGLLAALTEQAPLFHVEQGPVVILGAGGAARGAAAALKRAGCPDIRIVNRTKERAERLAEGVGGRAYNLAQASQAFGGASAVINATSAGLAGTPEVDWPLDAAPATAVVMDYDLQAARNGIDKVSTGPWVTNGRWPRHADRSGGGRVSRRSSGPPHPPQWNARALLLSALEEAS